MVVRTVDVSCNFVNYTLFRHHSLTSLYHISYTPAEPMASLTVEVPLSDEAQADPIYSVAAIIEAMVDIKTLNANIISPNKFEVFLPSTLREHLQTILQEKKYSSYPCTTYISRSSPSHFLLQSQSHPNNVSSQSGGILHGPPASSLGPSSGASASIASISS